MITKAQLEIYRLHWGNGDLLIREGRPAELAAVAGEPWRRIEALIWDTRSLDSGQLSLETAAELRDQIKRNTEDEATRQLLRKLAKDWPRIRPGFVRRTTQTGLGFTFIGLFFLGHLLVRAWPLALVVLTWIICHYFLP